ncbi:MAG TPA: glycosyl hydrolase, partial [Sediminibacterium sp.]|nr:glycosyl hydrolase [Sediminibacterium sp.]
AHAKNKSVRNQSHGSPGNILDLYAAVDIPETEGTEILRYKFASSAAHVTGKPLVSSETATWLGEHFQSTWGDVQHAVNGYFLGGVNHVFWHGIAYSPAQDPWPGWLFYAAVHFQPVNPQWADFTALNAYVTRCQQWLQQGRSDNPVLLYYPYYDRLAKMDRDLLQHFDGMKGFQHTWFDSTAQWLLQKGVDFDLISDRQLLDTHATNVAIHTSGNQYQTLVLSGVTYLPLKMMKHLQQLAASGARILFLQDLPAKVPGLFQYKEQELEMKQVWENVHWVISPEGYRQAAIGKGFFYWGTDLQRLLKQAGVVRETMTDAGWQFVRRQLSDGHLYFIRNANTTDQRGWVPLSAPEGSAAIYDPVTGNAGKARMRQRAGRQEIWLELAAGAACIVRTQSEPFTARYFPYYRKAGEPIKLTNNWQLHFESGGPLVPGDTLLPQPVFWTAFPGALYRSFSGRAVYRTTFVKPRTMAPYIQINPGLIRATGAVWLNGTKIATILQDGDPVIVPSSSLQTNNTLEISVSSTMANRIAYMDRAGIAWKKFYNTNFPARLPENRDSQGLFTAARW